MILVKYCDLIKYFYRGYEIDVGGFAVMTVEEWKTYQESARDYRGNFTFYIINYEPIYYENTEKLLGSLKVEEITDTQANFLMDKFGAEYGVFPNVRYFDMEDEDREHASHRPLYHK